MDAPNKKPKLGIADAVGAEEEPREFSPRNCCNLAVMISVAMVVSIFIVAVVIVIPVMNKFS